jgi:hypothetical protein
MMLVACGSSEDPSTSTDSRSASSSSPVTSSSSAAAPSLAQLKKIVLQQSDLPAGWKATPYEVDPSTEAAADADLMKCVGARNTYRDRVARADSDEFTLGDASIRSSAISYRSQSAVDADVAMLHNPKIALCYEQVLKELAASSGVMIESMSIKITPGWAGGPANVVATGTGIAKVSGNGQQAPTYTTVAFITGPLIEAEVDADNIGKPVPASRVNALVASVAARAAKD